MSCWNNAQALSAKLMENSPSFTEAIIITETFSDEDFQEISEAMKKNTTLEKITIRGDAFGVHARTRLSGHAAMFLSSAFMDHPTLINVSFRWFHIEDISHLYLAFLHNKHKMSGLHLQRSDWGNNVQSIFKLLLKSDALKRFALINCKTTGNDDTIDLSGAIGQNRSLVELSLRGFCLNETTQREIAWMISENQNIQLLDFHFVFRSQLMMDNIVSSAHRHESLRSFTFSHKVDDMVVKVIGSMARTAQKLERLKLTYCGMNEMQFKCLLQELSSNQCKLKALDLSNGALNYDESSECVAALADFIRKDTGLETLDFRVNIIEESGVSLIAHSLKENHNLRRLDLSYSSIGPQAAMDIANALSTNNSVTQLTLRGNSIGIQGATKIANALGNNSSLTHLDVSETDDENVGGIILQGLVNNTTLTHLTVDSLNDGDVDAVVACLPFVNGLKHLEVGRFVVSQENVNLIANTIEVHNRTLERIEIRANHDIDTTRLDYILELNRGGRRILPCRNVPDALWARILGRSSGSVDILYVFLREKATLYTRLCKQTTATRKRKRNESEE